MYARFYRWAFDRLEDNGVVAFVTNRSFIESRTFDGFRKTIQNEFDYAYIIDTKSDVRANPKIAGTTHNIFGIQTGVAIMFLIKNKKRDNKTCKIHYAALDDFWRKEQKLQWLAEHPLKQINFEIIRPDKNNNWLDIAENDFETLLPLADKAVKLGRSKKALFELFSTGISTNRDEWVTDNSAQNLKEKMEYFTNYYHSQLKSNTDFTKGIKWSRNLKQRFQKNRDEKFDSKRIIEFNYRPFSSKFLYYSEVFIDEHGLSEQIFRQPNLVFTISGNGASKPFHLLASSSYHSLDFLEKTQCLPLYRYDKDGNRVDNITDWGLEQFCKHYKAKPLKEEIEESGSEIRHTENEELGKPYEEYPQPHLQNNKIHEPAAHYGKFISKQAIFHYVYAVLHHPAYRKKYELNLKREFPRIPFYKDFYKWVDWGKTLMELHLNYESIKPYKLKEITTGSHEMPKAKLKAQKESGKIILDENTVLTDIPKEAWLYKLGNRSALEWILDQYKESKPKDPTIAEKFNTYKFADYKKKVIDLLKRVCTVSVETMKVIEEMEKTNK